MEVVVWHEAFRALRQISFGRFVFGLSLHELVLALCSTPDQQGDGASHGMGVQHSQGAHAVADSVQHDSTGAAFSGVSEDDLEDVAHQKERLVVRLVKQMCGGVAAERQGLQARDMEIEAAQDMLRQAGVRDVCLTLSNIIM
jgi:hypothetical protein